MVLTLSPNGSKSLSVPNHRPSSYQLFNVIPIEIGKLSPELFEKVKSRRTSDPTGVRELKLLRLLPPVTFSLNRYQT